LIPRADTTALKTPVPIPSLKLGNTGCGQLLYDDLRKQDMLVNLAG